MTTHYSLHTPHDLRPIWHMTYLSYSLPSGSLLSVPYSLLPPPYLPTPLSLLLTLCFRTPNFLVLPPNCNTVPMLRKSQDFILRSEGPWKWIFV